MFVLIMCFYVPKLSITCISLPNNNKTSLIHSQNVIICNSINWTVYIFVMATPIQKTIH